MSNDHKDFLPWAHGTDYKYFLPWTVINIFSLADENDHKDFLP